MVKYIYNAWGEILSITGPMASTIGAYNPFRYKGYYYDDETGFYYLINRYYDPVMKRFISADSFASTGQGFTGTNMFAYCGNNPVSRVDENGDFWHILAAAFVVVGSTVAGAVIGAGAKYVSNWLLGYRGEDLFNGVNEAAIGGGTFGFLFAISGGNPIISSYGGAYAEQGAIQYGNYRNGGMFDWDAFWWNGFASGSLTLLTLSTFTAPLVVSAPTEHLIAHFFAELSNSLIIALPVTYVGPGLPQYQSNPDRPGTGSFVSNGNQSASNIISQVGATVGKAISQIIASTILVNIPRGRL